MWLKLDTGMVVMLLLLRVLQGQSRVTQHLTVTWGRAFLLMNGRLSRQVPWSTFKKDQHWAGKGAFAKEHKTRTLRGTP